MSNRWALLYMGKCARIARQKIGIKEVYAIVIAHITCIEFDNRRLRSVDA